MQNKTYISFLLLGSNMGNSLVYLQQSKELLVQQGNIILSESAIYETAAWGNNNQPNFLNQVIKIETKFNAEILLKKNLEIELHMGRERLEKMGPRTIDIDILLYENLIIKTKNLKIPHPRLQDRKFVLIPLNEIAPNFIHPIYKQTINQLLHQCKDELDVKKFY